MHMEAVTIRFYSTSTDHSSAGHDYNLELEEEKTLLLSLPSRLHVSDQQCWSKRRDAEAENEHHLHVERWKRCHSHARPLVGDVFCESTIFHYWCT